MKKYLSAICGAVCLILPLPCFVYSQPCNNWLYLAPGLKANIGIGDLDMSGDQLIVEPVFCRTTAYPPEYHGGDLVSKQAHQYDCTCVLRPNLGYRNGVLQSQVAATGSLFQQDLRGQIGYYSEGITNSNFEGYLNAV